jgi:hypothetical protein
MGLMPPGATSSGEDDADGSQGDSEAAESEGGGSEDAEEEGEEEEEDADEQEGEEYEDEGGYGYGNHFVAVLPGGHDGDIVIGAPIGRPAHAAGTLPQRLPGDTQVTARVWAREQADGRHILYGGLLANCPKLLTRIFKMRQQPGQLAWRSDLPLRGFEWNYLKEVFAHTRLQQGLQHGRRVLKPLPDYGFPHRFRPTDA